MMRLPNESPEKFGASKRSFFAGELIRGKQVLARGGVFMIVADGYVGWSDGIPVDFLGRRRVIYTGFAELAVMTGAPVVPVFAGIDGKGRVTLRFMAPLQAAGADREEKVESLVRQYAEILMERWRNSPWDVTWKHMRKFPKLPAVERRP